MNALLHLSKLHVASLQTCSSRGNDYHVASTDEEGRPYLAKHTGPVPAAEGFVAIRHIAVHLSIISHGSSIVATCELVIVGQEG